MLVCEVWGEAGLSGLTEVTMKYTKDFEVSAMTGAAIRYLQACAFDVFRSDARTFFRVEQEEDGGFIVVAGNVEDGECFEQIRRKLQVGEEEWERRVLETYPPAATATIHVTLPAEVKAKWVRMSRADGQKLGPWLIERIERALREEGRGDDKPAV